MLKNSRTTITTVAVLCLAALTLTSCAKRVDGGANLIEINSSDKSCEISTSSIGAGSITFSISNTGTKVTEVYIFAEDRKTILSEAENIGPSIKRDLITQLNEGTYFINCVPGMKGDGFFTELTVTAGKSLDSSEHAGKLVTAAQEYKDFVISQATSLLKETEKFAALYKSGNDTAARELYPRARMYWERIEPVAESFGDLDPILDLREADLEEGQVWTGWHLIEKDLWAPAGNYTPLTSAGRSEAANLLVAKTAELLARVKELDYKPFQMSNGAKELLDEVATGKVTGEEEIWSGTDLFDFQANVEGAEKVFSLFKEIVQEKDRALAEKLERNFAKVFALLNEQKVGTGFKSYDQLSTSIVRDMAAAVDALAEPLSHLTAVIVGS